MKSRGDKKKKTDKGLLCQSNMNSSCSGMWTLNNTILRTR